MIYARVHDRTVAEDYYTAMARIEVQLGVSDPGDVSIAPPLPDHPNAQTLLTLVEALAASRLDDTTRLSLVAQLRELMQADVYNPDFETRN